MTEANQQSFTADTSAEGIAPRHVKTMRQRIPAPIWRFRPKLKPASVVKSFKNQIIPKIVLALRRAPRIAEPDEQPGLSAVAQFAALVLRPDEGPAFAHIEDLVARGVSVEFILLELLAPTARHFGNLWESDVTDFANVTIAVSRLQRIMRRLGESFFNEGNRGGGESILLTIIPGEQHSFGLSMVAEFFRRAGWNPCMGPFSSRQELTSLVHNQWFDVIGFSVSSNRRLDELKKDIHDIRHDSRNRNVGIMLGGPMVIAQPALVASVGADMISLDAVTAPQQARILIEQMRCQH